MLKGSSFWSTAILAVGSAGILPAGSRPRRRGARESHRLEKPVPRRIWTTCGEAFQQSEMGSKEFRLQPAISCLSFEFSKKPTSNRKS
jgi:hypothetical protein